MGESNGAEKENGFRFSMNFSWLKWERIQSIIIVILFIIILLMSKCSGSKQPIEIIKEPTKVITKVETKWDTVEIKEKVYVPKWKTKIIHDTTFVEIKIPTEVDTTEILKDYYTKYEYQDTLFLDSLGYLVLTDTITQNSILKRKQVPYINIPTKTITVTEYINNREFYAGFGGRVNYDGVSWMGLEGAFRNKKGNLFLIGVGTNHENKLSLGGSVHWKIGEN